MLEQGETMPGLESVCLNHQGDAPHARASFATLDLPTADDGSSPAEDGYGGLPGRPPAMRAIYQLIRRVAPTSATVLITGESGTGKELVARAIHAASPRGAQRLVAVHCGAIPEDLLES